MSVPRRGSRLEIDFVQLFALLLFSFDTFGTDALGRRPYAAQEEREAQTEQNGNGGPYEILDPMFLDELNHTSPSGINRYERRMTSVTTSDTTATFSRSTL